MRYLLLALALVPLRGTALPINLLVNGSFELPALTATQNLAGPFTLTGWTGQAPSNGGNAGLVLGTNNGLTPAEGQQHFTFNGGNPSDQGYLEQTIATTPGTVYDLAFSVGRAGGGQSLSLTILGQTFLPPPAPGYLLHTLTFTATGPLTTLRFTDTSDGNSISDLYLDNVSVTATVPDTGPNLAILCGLCALLFTRRKE